METAIVILSGLCLVQFLCIGFLSNVLIDTIKENKNKVKKLEDKVEEFDSILPGDKVCFNFRLIVWENDLKEKSFPFDVDYEANVVEISKDKLKVNAYLVNSVNQAPGFYTKKPNYKNGLILFMTGKWIDRKDAHLIMEQEYIRDKKLIELLK